MVVGKQIFFFKEEIFPFALQGKFAQLLPVDMQSRNGGPIH
jgi:hypothetical protein